MEPFNYAGMMAQARDLVPSILDQEIKRSLGQAQVEQAQANSALMRQKVAADIADRQQQEQYGREVSMALESGDPRAISALIARYPQFKDALKTNWDQMDTIKQRSEMRQAAGVWSALSAGNTGAAIKIIKDRMASDAAAGLPADEEDADALAMLESGDPKAVNTVKGKLGLFMASVVPEKFSSVVEQLGTGTDKKDWKVVGDTVGYGGDDGQWHTAYVAPDRFTIDNTRFETPGQVPGAAQGGVPQSGDILSQMLPITVSSESGGNPNAVSPKGARGLMQVMPGTQADPGFGVAPLPANATPEQVAAQGGQYLRAMMERYGGDPAKAWAAYNAGPGAVDKALASGGNWLSRLPSETRAYVNKNMSQLRRGGQQGGGAVATASVPKVEEKTRILSPQEVAAIPGLDPNVVYQQSPEGTITPVGGQKQGQLKPWPATALASVASNNTALKPLQEVSWLLNPANNSDAAKNARNGIGTFTGALGNTVTNYRDPKGVAIRTAIGKIGSLIIKDTSGAAVSLSEDERLAKWVPLVTDEPNVAREKLGNLIRELNNRNAAMEDLYSEDQGYRPLKQRKPQQQASNGGFRILGVRPK